MCFEMKLRRLRNDPVCETSTPPAMLKVYDAVSLATAIVTMTAVVLQPNRPAGVGSARFLTQRRSQEIFMLSLWGFHLVLTEWIHAVIAPRTGWPMRPRLTDVSIWKDVTLMVVQMAPRRWLLGVGAGMLLLVGGVAAGPVASFASNAPQAQIADADQDENEASVPAGTLDDGDQLLSQATITIEQAISAAQAAADGGVGEVDLEYANDRLVFNVDIGKQDVKVDAADGSIVSLDSDD